MNRLDLYQIHGLDRGRPPVDLAAQLTAELDQTQDPLSRSRIETARAVLGDPALRARYDALLADPSVTVDEATLATLAGRPVPRRSAFAEPKAKVLAGVVAALALVLVIAVIAVVATSGGDDSTTAATDATTGSVPQQSSSTAPSKKKCSGLDDADVSRWLAMPDLVDPDAALVITDEVALPSSFDGLGSVTGIGPGTDVTGFHYWQGLTQLADGSAMVRIGVAPAGQTPATKLNTYFEPTELVAVVSADGQVRDEGTAPRTAGTQPWDQTYDDAFMNQASAAAPIVNPPGGGAPVAKADVLSSLVSATDPQKVFLLLKGDPTLYLARVVVLDEPAASLSKDPAAKIVTACS